MGLTESRYADDDAKLLLDIQGERRSCRVGYASECLVLRKENAMEMLENINGRPVNIESEKKWYEKILDLHKIDAEGACLMLVPAGFDTDGQGWALINGETMLYLNGFVLEDGDTVEGLAEYLRKCIPGAEISSPTAIGTMTISTQSESHRLRALCKDLYTLLIECRSDDCAFENPEQEIMRLREELTALNILQ